jgi:hypothetical protein
VLRVYCHTCGTSYIYVKLSLREKETGTQSPLLAPSWWSEPKARPVSHLVLLSGVTWVDSTSLSLSFLKPSRGNGVPQADAKTSWHFQKAT